jgi:hypothetical protein
MVKNAVVYLKTEYTGKLHTYIVLPVEVTQLSRMKELFSKYTPSVTFSAIFCRGHPYIAIDYGFGNTMKAALRLDEQFESGDRLGDKFCVGDVATFILTDKPQDQLVEPNKKVSFNFTLDEIIAYSFTYTKEMEEIYSLYLFYQQQKGNVKDKPTKPKRNGKQAYTT